MTPPAGSGDRFAAASGVSTPEMSSVVNSASGESPIVGSVFSFSLTEHNLC